MYQNHLQFEYNILDIYEIVKAFKECQSGNICKKPKLISKDRECEYLAHMYLVQFCFNASFHLTYVELHNRDILSPSDVTWLTTVINIFLKV